MKSFYDLFLALVYSTSYSVSCHTYPLRKLKTACPPTFFQKKEHNKLRQLVLKEETDELFLFIVRMDYQIFFFNIKGYILKNIS